MPKFIIVKYAQAFWPNGKAPIEASIDDTYTVHHLGIPRGPYNSKEEAVALLPALNQFNPTVDYGVVEVDENEKI